MKITKEQVMQVAHLARLEVDEADMERIAEQIDKILEYIDTLGKAETEGVEPSFQGIDHDTAFREDIPAGHIGSENATANSPSSEDGYFIVPKVIG